MLKGEIIAMPRKLTPDEILEVKRYISPTNLAILLDVAVKTIYNKLSSGDMEIPFTRYGRAIRFKREDVLAHLEKNEVRPEAD